MSKQNYVGIKPKNCCDCGKDYTPIIHSDECPHDRINVREQDVLVLTNQEYMKLVKYVPFPAHDLRKVAKAQLAKVLKHRLDRPELSEKIAKKLREIYRYDLDWYPTWAKLTQKNKDRWLKKADQILALIPDEEELKETIAYLEEAIQVMPECIEEEAKREERERILEFMNEQGAVFADRAYDVIEAVRKGKHRQVLKGERE